MKKNTGKAAQPKTRAAGFTIIELIIAAAILAGAIITTFSIVQAGIGKLNDMRVKNQVRECARLAMEYYSALPPDVVYAMSKNAPRTGNFMTGLAGADDMATFVTDTYPVCKDLSDPGNPVGSRVLLNYTICPGCYTYKDPDPEVVYSTCKYYFKFRVTYNAVRYGGENQHMDYTLQTYTAQSGDCDVSLNSRGCGSSMGGETHKSCDF